MNSHTPDEQEANPQTNFILGKDMQTPRLNLKRIQQEEATNKHLVPIFVEESNSQFSTILEECKKINDAFFGILSKNRFIIDEIHQVESPSTID